MRFWIDTEFNGWRGQLISLALVAEDGREWYEVLDWDIAEGVEPWVAEHVMPVTGKAPIGRPHFAASLAVFLEPYDDNVHIIGDYPDDFKYLCDVLVVGPGERIGPRSFTMTLRDDLGSTAVESAIPHNALEDARALRSSHLAKQTVSP